MIALFLLPFCFVLQAKIVDQLVIDLGSQVFKIRENASRQLKKMMNPDVCVYLKKERGKKHELEVQRRIDAVLDDYSASLPGLHGYPKYPWIKWMPDTCRNNYLRENGCCPVEVYLVKVRGPEASKSVDQDYLDQSKATELWVFDEARSVRAKAKTEKERQSGFELIENRLQAMARSEDHYWKIVHEKPNPLRVSKK